MPNDLGGHENGYLRDTPVELNRYFLGKFLSARDFDCDQSYFRERRWMINRALTGPGIISGLIVRWERNANGDGCLHISPGIAFDGMGREIILRREECRDFEVGSSGSLYIRYGETDVDPVPSLAMEEGETDRDIVMNRLQETPFIEFIADGDTGADDPLPHTSALGVFLARLEPGVSTAINTEGPDKYYDVHHHGRFYAARDPLDWPVIDRISWEHAHPLELPVSEPIELVFTFNRQVALHPRLSASIAPFSLMLSGKSSATQQIEADWRFDRDGLEFVLTISPDTFAQLSGDRLDIHLNSELLIDHYGRTLDGAAASWRATPSGNGIPGSRFESWVTISDSHTTEPEEEASS